MSDDAELDEKLARLSGRFEASRSRAREIMGRDAELLCLADALKKTFNARLVWLKCGNDEIGTEPEAGVVPAEYHPPKQRR